MSQLTLEHGQVVCTCKQDPCTCDGGIVPGPYFDFAPNKYMRSAMYVYDNNCECECCEWMRKYQLLHTGVPDA